MAVAFDLSIWLGLPRGIANEGRLLQFILDKLLIL